MKDRKQSEHTQRDRRFAPAGPHGSWPSRAGFEAAYEDIRRRRPVAGDPMEGYLLRNMGCVGPVRWRRWLAARYAISPSADQVGPKGRPLPSLDWRALFAAPWTVKTRRVLI